MPKVFKLQQLGGVIQQILNAVSGKAEKSELNAHTGNGNVHVSTTEKNRWNDTYTKTQVDERIEQGGKVKGVQVNGVDLPIDETTKKVNFVVDNTPKDNSENFVKSGGVRTWFSKLCEQNGLTMPGVYRVTLPSSMSHYSMSDTSTTEVSEGNGYQNTIVPASGYSISNVVVTMGGVNITSQCYSDGAIDIQEVTGDIVITVAVLSNNLTISNASGLSGFTTSGFTSPVARGSSVDIVFTRAQGRYVTTPPYAKMGSATINAQLQPNGTYAVHIGSVTDNVTLYGVAKAEDRYYVGGYTMGGSKDAALIGTGALVVSGQQTSEIVTDSFFIAYPSTKAFPGSVALASFGITFDESKFAAAVTATYNEVTYNIRTYNTNNAGVALGDKLIITI